MGRCPGVCGAGEFEGRPLGADQTSYRIPAARLPAHRSELSPAGRAVFRLQKVSGHSWLEMTRRYAKLVTAGLQAMH